MSDHETDYLVVGAGAVGLAFVDTLIARGRGAGVTTLFKLAGLAKKRIAAVKALAR